MDVADALAGADFADGVLTAGGFAADDFEADGFAGDGFAGGGFAAGDLVRLFALELPEGDVS